MGRNEVLSIIQKETRYGRGRCTQKVIEWRLVGRVQRRGSVIGTVTPQQTTSEGPEHQEDDSHLEKYRQNPGTHECGFLTVEIVVDPRGFSFEVSGEVFTT